MRGSLRIAGMEVGIRAPQGLIEELLVDRYGPFLGPVDAPLCSLQFEANGLNRSSGNPPMAEVTATAAGYRIEHPDFSADLDLTGPGQVITVANPFAIDHLFRVIIALLVPRHDALMLHACGIIDGGRAHVFAGRSGAGKSTLASLAGERPLLSDEHVVVRRMGHGWIAASTPFWGAYAKPGPARQARLAGLWSLRQHPTNGIAPLDPMAGLRVALNNAVLPAVDSDVRRLVFDRAVDLAAAVPAAELRFTPTAEVWEAFDARAHAAA